MRLGARCASALAREGRLEGGRPAGADDAAIAEHVHRHRQSAGCKRWLDA